MKCKTAQYEKQESVVNSAVSQAWEPVRARETINEGKTTVISMEIHI